MQSKTHSDPRVILMQQGCALLDGLAIVCAALMAWFVVNLRVGHDWVYFLELYSLPVIFAAIMIPVVLSWFGGYHKLRYTSLWQQLQLVWTVWAVILMILLLLAFATQAGKAYSRFWVTGWFALGLANLLLVRVLIRWVLAWLRRAGFDRRRVVVVGSGETVGRVLDHLQRQHWTGFNVIGAYTEDLAPGNTLRDVRVWGGLRDVNPTAIAGAQVQQVWLAMSLSEEERMREILFSLRNSTVDICFIPDIFDFQLLNCAATDIAGMPVLNLTVTPMHGIQGLIKEVQDRVQALLLLLFLSPAMLLIAIGIRVGSHGPALFKQQRMGWDDQPFWVYKFRTMYIHEEPQGQLQQATRGDARITPFGAFLRKSSLDELPQLFNVLNGQMSLVGPRPHAMAHDRMYKEIISRYTLRHKVKPGITGWAQIHGLRGETETVDDMRKRVEYDLYYIRNYSLLLDFRIMFSTIRLVFKDKSAY